MRAPPPETPYLRIGAWENMVQEGIEIENKFSLFKEVVF